MSGDSRQCLHPLNAMTTYQGRRTREGDGSNTKVKQRQYQVDRWRLDEQQSMRLIQRSRRPNDKPDADRPTSNRSCSDQDSIHGNIHDSQDQSISAPWFPLPVDHLLHLIKYNVFRGLAQNKALIESSTIQYQDPDALSHGFCNHTVFPSYSVIMPVVPDLSGSLTPTPTQMNMIHSTWINFLPFPTLRDSFIKWEFSFDHSELIKDLVGDLINWRIFLSASSILTAGPADGTRVVQKNSDSTATQTGLIVWGEPHLADSWEATPEFLQKWAWAAMDCQELIDSTNRWRTSRGEGPLFTEKITS
ncbi:unnamed protein product [Periconia digitata]|uniref:Uncharacterized protein n=1 Tax=Periconia digitata TaxID=1303443 RepID=A0A9W4USN6_9PLEO|nr:unnamed protein product [Periconia digitata]